ncbi:MAG: exodeoxyribonuclease VII small subunit [Gammaproteobacteria bacterium]|nr:exodeoxyribonuclease VII small subunit [Gammaproteobacteria bacterium]
MPKKKSDSPSAIPDFEAALSELETLVEKMESSEQSLEEALTSFQRGVELTRTCQKGLKEAEQRVEKLIKQTEDSGTEPFSPDS